LIRNRRTIDVIHDQSGIKVGGCIVMAFHPGSRSVPSSVVDLFDPATQKLPLRLQPVQPHIIISCFRIIIQIK
jgi:hypothetical protein